MPTITLPDGSTQVYDDATSGAQIAAAIGEGLARAAVAVKVDGAEWDLTRPIEGDATVAIVTRDSDDGLELLRHDAAHVLAEAVKELWPETQVTIGPAIENGFYYDFSREEPFTDADLETIEQRMKDIVDRDEVIEREVWERAKAVEFFRDMGEEYKAEIIDSIPSDEDVTLYRQGEFIDLCRGPHLPSTGKLGKSFKLTHVSGAYWRGDSNNEMLQRIYGTAWSNDKQLRQYLHMLEEAEKRDHRRLANVMDLFHFQEEAPGAVFWHPNGWTVFQNLIAHMRKTNTDAGYQEVNTPEMVSRTLWERSGHWETFGEHMFTSETVDGRTYAVKPMNCPGHIQVFNQGIRSYRDLPLRLAEFGKCHRYEPSGALHGMMRVRAFTQDDAHIFCTAEQITDESIAVCKLILELYRVFGFEDVKIKFADRPEVRVGEDAVWDQAEAALLKALEAGGYEYTHNPGEGAFYGPKLEFALPVATNRIAQYELEFRA
ncbi:MAG: threonine--tRNA ligase, partial [Pseudomonadota bacterium]